MRVLLHGSTRAPVYPSRSLSGVRGRPYSCPAMSPVRFACVSALVFAVLAINGCGGGGDAEPAPPPAPSKAFVADRGQATIGSSSNSNPAPGTVVAERRIVGA